MKKFIALTIILLLSVTVLCGFRACGSIKEDFFDDGDFTYYYASDKDCYAIVDTTKEGRKKDTLIVPAYYKGKEVRYITYIDHSLAQNRYFIYTRNANKLYLSYLHEMRGDDYFVDILPKKVYFVKNDESYVNSMLTYIRSGGGIKAYVTPLFFNYAICLLKTMEHYIIEKETDNYFTYYTKAANMTKGEVQIANSSYHFNYEGAPNKGYFFIDDFARGGKIENTPYEPQREGYNFAGWYKESECEHVWDFAEDTLPAAEYDEQGNLIFTETKLFANWTKS